MSGTLVLTKNGFKEIQNIADTDQVLTHTNSYKKVIAPMVKAYKGDLYTIKAMPIDELYCTSEHPFYVRRKYRQWNNNRRVWERKFENPKWVEAKDLSTDYYLGVAINQESKLPTWGGVIDNRWGHQRHTDNLSCLFKSNSFWYLMGRYIGDGWKRSSSSGKGIIICCGGRNEDKLIQVMNDCGIHFVVANERTVRKYHICSKELHDFCGRYGYYAGGKMIDGETLDLPIPLLKSFLDGCFDSDGYTTKDGYIKYSSVSKNLIYGIAQCVAKVYHRPYSIYYTSRKPKAIIEGRMVNQQGSYTMTFKSEICKQDHAFFQDGFIWAPIQSINSAYKECEVFNLSVEDDESYTANGIIVHNCTDISNAGRQEGLAEGSGTRSSLLWECKRAIAIKRPKYLLMENVKALTSKKFAPYLQKWEEWLSEQGYCNFTQVLNAKDYGVPQNRERVFMVSILKENAVYYFPKPFELKSRLKDVLEKRVDEKYYLSDKMIKCFENRTAIAKEKGNGFRFNPTDGGGTAKAITTCAGNRTDDNYIDEQQKT